MRNVIYTKQFCKDWRKARKTPLARAIEKLVALIQNNPFQNPPPYEKLRGYEHTYSRRINEQHRFVYIVDGDEIAFAGCWGHYE